MEQFFRIGSNLTTVFMDPVRIQFKRRILSRKGFISFAIGALASVSLLIFFVAVRREAIFFPVKVFTQGAIIIFALVLIVLVIQALRREAICGCSNCGAPIRIGMKSVVMTGDKVIHCSMCRAYFEIKDNMLVHIPYNFISVRAIFRARVSPASILPDECCVCGTKTSQFESYKFERCEMLPQAPFPARQVLGEIKIPYCGAHCDGAIVTGEFPDFFIQFRSYPYFRLFCHANELSPE